MSAMSDLAYQEMMARGEREEETWWWQGGNRPRSRAPEPAQTFTEALVEAWARRNGPDKANSAHWLATARTLSHVAPAAEVERLRGKGSPIWAWFERAR